MSREIRDLIEFEKAARVRKDEASGAIVLEGVKLLGNRSVNVNPDGTQNVYTFEARKAALSLYEGAKVFVNHPERTNPNRERGYEEQLGRVRNVEARESGTWGDVWLNPKHPYAEQAAWDAEHSPDSLGMSHNAQGRGRVEGKDTLIEQITRVRSLDLVCAAATTKGLFESRQDTPQEGPGMLKQLIEAMQGAEGLEAKLLEMVDEAAIVACLTDEAMTADEKVLKALGLLAAGKVEDGEHSEAPEDPPGEDMPESVAPEASDEVAELRAKVVMLEAARAAEETRRERDELLESSLLPAKAKTKDFVSLVHEAKSKDEALKLIEHTKRLCFHEDPNTSRGNPSSGQPTEIKTADDFVAAL